jgi:hypothetical protein
MQQPWLKEYLLPNFIQGTLSILPSFSIQTHPWLILPFGKLFLHLL